MDKSGIHDTMDKLSQLLGYTTPDRIDEGTGHDDVNVDNCDRKKGGTNLLLYGVPGCGKSYMINSICPDSNFIERVVFHPDYTNADFGGQILPYKDGDKLDYKFKAGPFTRILKKALDDKNNMYYLVIEELNRGNASAIFGDVFQLLDRDDNGTSCYEINNEDIATYIYNDENKRDVKFRIPSNLTILATMNTSDQNVFTLDTAFQRRWEMEHIPNDFDNVMHKEQVESKVEADITWYAFAKTINKAIVNITKSYGMSEDKQLGVYFTQGDGITNKKKFAEKVLKYLWDDAVKIERGTIFDENKVTTFEDVVNMYIKNGFKDVLNGELYNAILNCPLPNYSHNEESEQE